MSRGYLKSKNHTDINISLISTIVITVAIYSHRSGLFKIVTGVLVLYSLYFIYSKTRLLQRKYRFQYVSGTSISEIDTMTGLEFERFVAKLLKQKGYTDIKLTEKFDYGVDIIATKDGIRWGIQVKRYSGLVKADAVRQVVTALKYYNCDRSMVITNSFFSNVAKDLAKSNECLLVNRSTFIK